MIYCIKKIFLLCVMFITCDMTGMNPAIPAIRFSLPFYRNLNTQKYNFRISTRSNIYQNAAPIAVHTLPLSAQKLHIQKESKQSIDTAKKGSIRGPALKVTKEKPPYKQDTDIFACQKAFVPIDVSQRFIHAFAESKDVLSLTDSMTLTANDVFAVARECDYYVLPEIKSHTHDLIDSIRTTNNPAKIIFNGAMADQVLSDVLQQTAAHVSAPQSLLDRAPGLVVRAATKFVYGLNPIKQVGDSVKLGVDIGRFVGNSAYRVGAGAVDIAANFGSDGQIAAMHTFTEGAIEFLTSTARFTSTVTVGHLYLSPEEYQQRIDDYWQAASTACERHVATCRELGEMGAAAASELTAEQVVDLGAQLAADMVFAKGISRAVQYAKEVQVMAKANKKGSEIAGRLKNAVDVVMAERPVAVTAEGMMFHIADEAGHVGGAAKAAISGSSILRTADEVATHIAQKNEIQKIILHIQSYLEKLTHGSNKIKEIGGDVFDVTHTFSKKHIDANILKVGESIDATIASAKVFSTQIIEKIKQADTLNLLIEGPNTIRTHINGVPTEIRAFIEKDKLISFNAFIKYSARNVKHLIEI